MKEIKNKNASTYVRVQKIISDSGLCSRRKAEEMLAQGLVKVNGRPAKIGDKADPRRDIVTVGDEKVSGQPPVLRYLKLYKPRGYMTSMEDEHGKKLVAELVQDIPQRVYPVGRLDKDSEGLLLFTNDGAFANMLMHPKNRVKKVYRVTIPSAVSDEKLEKLRSGVEIQPGVFTKPCNILPIVEGNERTVLEFTLEEGKNRQIRRMCDTVGLKVSRLRRTSEGGVKLGMLKPGEYADLTLEELKSLYQAAGGSLPGRKKDSRERLSGNAGNKEKQSAGRPDVRSKDRRKNTGKSRGSNTGRQA